MNDPKELKAWAERPRSALVKLPDTDPGVSVPDEELDLAAFAPSLPPTHAQIGDTAPPAKAPGRFGKGRGEGKSGKGSGRGPGKAKSWARSKGKKATS